MTRFFCILTGIWHVKMIGYMPRSLRKNIKKIDFPTRKKEEDFSSKTLAFFCYFPYTMSVKKITSFGSFLSQNNWW